MVDITGVNSQPNQPNRIENRSVSKSSASKSKESSTSGSAGDRIEISADAKEAHTVGRLVQSARSQPEVRAEAVARAKEKLENGEYEGVVVSRETAKKILGLT
ncbi:MAG: flagellar biosynthesis anti-sigma factor FlgM [bacterium]|jgi:anti-sigma28 factor (negative regulator of flagellin synthesis)